MLTEATWLPETIQPITETRQPSETPRRVRVSIALVLLQAAFLSLVFSGMIFAQDLRVTADEVECLPIGENAVGWGTVDNNLPNTEVRLYFRRLHDVVEDAYYVRMNAQGEGRYWGVFPKPEDQEMVRHQLEDRDQDLRAAYDEALRQSSDDYQSEEYEWARWWRSKVLAEDRDPNDSLDQDLIRERASVGREIERDWLREMDDRTFQEWLERQQNEPAEYFVAVHDADGKRLAQSDTRVAEVKEQCDVVLTPAQVGEAENLTIGETATWQKGEEIFHWQCDGIVSRRDPFGILRGDEICRACVIAWWQNPKVLIPASIATLGVTGIIISDDDPPPASPVTP